MPHSLFVDVTEFADHVQVCKFKCMNPYKLTWQWSSLWSGCNSFFPCKSLLLIRNENLTLAIRSYLSFFLEETIWYDETYEIKIITANVHRHLCLDQWFFLDWDVIILPFCTSPFSRYNTYVVSYMHTQLYANTKYQACATKVYNLIQRKTTLSRTWKVTQEK